MGRIVRMVALAGIMVGASMGMSHEAVAKGDKSNIVGGPIVWMQSTTLDGTRINKNAVKNLKMRQGQSGSGNSATPMPLPGVR